MRREYGSAGAWLGVVAVLAGLATAAAVHYHPEALNTPPWVAYLACAVFVAAGVSILLRAAGRARLAAWAGFTIPVAFTVIAGWIAFGPGARACTATLPFVTTTTGGGTCRAVFGVSALLCAGVTALFLRGLLRDGAAARGGAGEEGDGGP